ncbi:hypothetical protein BLNAU_12738 [Blattamonas nauphoetae]|uniref:Uncharacterized protein n=1 Tax=Blattamonas nauphoetae TaxID=2049346 RepID=A0ABQ9XIT6_9EUKA|nr:hypothetical protein BLNAU_12738 [Blattamonas nauphoetae]
MTQPSLPSWWDNTQLDFSAMGEDNLDRLRPLAPSPQDFYSKYIQSDNTSQLVWDVQNALSTTEDYALSFSESVIDYFKNEWTPVQATPQQEYPPQTDQTVPGTSTGITSQLEQLGGSYPEYPQQNIVSTPPQPSPQDPYHIPASSYPQYDSFPQVQTHTSGDVTPAQADYNSFIPSPMGPTQSQQTQEAEDELNEMLNDNPVQPHKPDPQTTYPSYPPMEPQPNPVQNTPPAEPVKQPEPQVIIQKVDLPDNLVTREEMNAAINEMKNKHTQELSALQTQITALQTETAQFKTTQTKLIGLYNDFRTFVANYIERHENVHNTLSSTISSLQTQVSTRQMSQTMSLQPPPPQPHPTQSTLTATFNPNQLGYASPAPLPSNPTYSPSIQPPQTFATQPQISSAPVIKSLLNEINFTNINPSMNLVTGKTLQWLQKPLHKVVLDYVCLEGIVSFTWQLSLKRDSDIEIGLEQYPAEQSVSPMSFGVWITRQGIKICQNVQRIVELTPNDTVRIEVNMKTSRATFFRNDQPLPVEIRNVPSAIVFCIAGSKAGTTATLVKADVLAQSTPVPRNPGFKELDMVQFRT